MFVLQDTVSKGVTAKDWVEHVAPLVNGKGGGTDMSASFSGDNVDGLKQAMIQAHEFAKLKL